MHVPCSYLFIDEYSHDQIAKQYLLVKNALARNILSVVGRKLEIRKYVSNDISQLLCLMYKLVKFLNDWRKSQCSQNTGSSW